MRKRREIVDLNTGKMYINESLAEKDVNVSRYYIHKSLTNHNIFKGQMFAYYSYGMNIEDIKKQYEANYSEKLTRSKKWQNLTRLTELGPTRI